MDYLDMLNGPEVASSKEIAAEIVTLEARKGGMKKQKGDASDTARGLRQEKLAGRDVQDGAIEAADTVKNGAGAFLNATRDALHRLDDLLLETIQKERDEECKRIEALAQAKMEEKKKRHPEMIKEFAAFVVKWGEVEGCDLEVARQEFTIRIAGNPDDSRLFKDEAARLLHGRPVRLPGLTEEAVRMQEQKRKVHKPPIRETVNALLDDARREAGASRPE